MKHYFKIIGSKEKGNYTIIECKNGTEYLCHKIKGNKRNGLKESRVWIGEYLLDLYGTTNLKFIHYHIKPGNIYDDKDEWTIMEYLKGLPPKKKRIYPSTWRESIERGREL